MLVINRCIGGVDYGFGIMRTQCCVFLSSLTRTISKLVESNRLPLLLALLRAPGNPYSGIGPVYLGGCVMVGGQTRAGDPVDPGRSLTLVLLAEGKKP